MALKYDCDIISSLLSMIWGPTSILKHSIIDNRKLPSTSVGLYK